jgi:hypothetical protein
VRTSSTACPAPKHIRCARAPSAVRHDRAGRCLRRRRVTHLSHTTSNEKQEWHNEFWLPWGASGDAHLFKLHPTVETNLKSHILYFTYLKSDL